MLLAIDVPTLGSGELTLRLVVASVLGAAIGIERELREREAGLRTHLLVALGAAIFTIVSAFGFADVLRASTPSVLARLDPSRIAAQIVSGIGFLGAGAIIRQGLSVRGLTTAASLWIAAAVGMAAGAGMYTMSVIGTVIAVVALGPLRIYAFRMIERFRPEEHRLVVELRPDATVVQLLQDVTHLGYTAQSLDVEDASDRRIATLTLDRPVAELVPTLSDRDYVNGVRWRR
jgi:putative Mg2+ transporter-C (MgtC) family protein